METAASTPEDDAQERGRRGTSRWFQRVLPMTGLAVALVALLALVWPAFRAEVALSTSRQPQPYVELYFPRLGPTGAPVTCLRRGGSVQVWFVVASHLERTERLAFRVRLDPRGAGERPLRSAGSVSVAPDDPRGVRRTFDLPRGTGYTVTVALPSLDQQLRAHCRGGRS